jgi:hypothetical protein
MRMRGRDLFPLYRTLVQTKRRDIHWRAKLDCFCPDAEQAKSNPGDVKWMETVFKSGTLSDKVAAATVMLQEAPVHMQGSLKFLVRLAFAPRRRAVLQLVSNDVSMSSFPTQHRLQNNLALSTILCSSSPRTCI